MEAGPDVGWDYPLTAMTAARLGEGKLAIDALLMTTKEPGTFGTVTTGSDQIFRVICLETGIAICGGNDGWWLAGVTRSGARRIS